MAWRAGGAIVVECFSYFPVCSPTDRLLSIKLAKLLKWATVLNM